MYYPTFESFLIIVFDKEGILTILFAKAMLLKSSIQIFFKHTFPAAWCDCKRWVGEKICTQPQMINKLISHFSTDQLSDVHFVSKSKLKCLLSRKELNSGVFRIKFLESKMSLIWWWKTKHWVCKVCQLHLRKAASTRPDKLFNIEKIWNQSKKDRRKHLDKLVENACQLRSGTKYIF